MIDLILIDRMHLSEIIDVQTYRGANIDSDQFQLMIKLRQKLSVANTSPPQSLKQIVEEKCVKGLPLDATVFE